MEATASQTVKGASKKQPQALNQAKSIGTDAEPCISEIARDTSWMTASHKHSCSTPLPRMGGNDYKGMTLPATGTKAGVGNDVKTNTNCQMATH